MSIFYSTLFYVTLYNLTKNVSPKNFEIICTTLFQMETIIYFVLKMLKSFQKIYDL